MRFGVDQTMRLHDHAMPNVITLIYSQQLFAITVPMAMIEPCYQGPDWAL